MVATNSCTLEKAPRQRRCVVSWLNHVASRSRAASTPHGAEMVASVSGRERAGASAALR